MNFYKIAPTLLLNVKIIMVLYLCLIMCLVIISERLSSPTSLNSSVCFVYSQQKGYKCPTQ